MKLSNGARLFEDSTNQSKISRKRQKQLLTTTGGRGNVEDVDHGWINNINAIIKLID